MTVVYALAGIGVVIVIALLAVGRLGELPAPTYDRPPLDLPAGSVDAADVEAVRFAVGVRGYRMDDVDLVLDRVADDLAARDLRIAELEGALAARGIDVPAQYPTGALVPDPPIDHPIEVAVQEPAAGQPATDEAP